MSIPLVDDAARVAYPVIWHLAAATSPAAAIVLGTLAIRVLLLPLTLAAVRAERAAFLPLLVQTPFFLVTYRLSSSATLAGTPNALLHSKLFGVVLSTHLLGGGHPLVFLPFIAVLAGLAWISSRRIRRLTGAVGPAGRPAESGPVGVAAWLPFASLFSASVLPLAAVLYLVTTTAWTVAENALLRRPG